ncbi:hypothetical protein TD95_003936 [Thielaviopsis punctulata]|uniref:RNA ligase/cyclic nucleotide phosphodiesterase n=1 Tax=Thielaviopsis punctulata TaxID=72032 RepID=A0A0F4ZDA0_9PEZI|nr:hypothetical protein TD95_003936 [Thielaviopsis punctulata]
MPDSRPNDFIADLSGLPSSTISTDSNPFNAFITACNNDLTTIRNAYESHRTKRNAAQAETFLRPGAQLAPDTILRDLLARRAVDERNCLVIWARPPAHILALAQKVQAKMTAILPDSWQHWLMPLHNMHLTVVEAAFSQTPAEIHALVARLRPHLPPIAHYTTTHRARLVRPYVSMDTSAFALSFLPAAGEPELSTQPPPGSATGCAPMSAAAAPVCAGDAYTYHHLRRDVYALVAQAGVQPAARYQVPSAHITLGRFVGATGESIGAEEARAFVRAVEEINQWLAATYAANNDPVETAEWIIGQERGLDVRYGPVWYGGGKSLIVGEGF